MPAEAYALHVLSKSGIRPPRVPEPERPREFLKKTVNEWAGRAVHHVANALEREGITEHPFTTACAAVSYVAKGMHNVPYAKWAAMHRIFHIFENKGLKEGRGELGKELVAWKFQRVFRNFNDVLTHMIDERLTSKMLTKMLGHPLEPAYAPTKEEALHLEDLVVRVARKTGYLLATPHEMRRSIMQSDVRHLLEAIASLQSVPEEQHEQEVDVLLQDAEDIVKTISKEHIATAPWIVDALVDYLQPWMHKKDVVKALTNVDNIVGERLHGMGYRYGPIGLVLLDVEPEKGLERKMARLRRVLLKGKKEELDRMLAQALQERGGDLEGLKQLLSEAHGLALKNPSHVIPALALHSALFMPSLNAEIRERFKKSPRDTANFLLALSRYPQFMPYHRLDPDDKHIAHLVASVHVDRIEELLGSVPYTERKHVYVPVGLEEEDKKVTSILERELGHPS